MAQGDFKLKRSNWLGPQDWGDRGTELIKSTPSKQATAATPSALRAAIDAGKTGDKVNAADPAAAPLDSDAEAAGTTVSTEDVRMALRAESVQPHPKNSGTGLGWAWLLVGFVGLCILLFIS